MLNELYISKAKEIYSGMPLGSIDLQHGDTEIRNGTGLIIPNNFEYYIKVSALKFSQTPIRFIVTSGTVQIGIASLHDKDNDSLAGDVITADKQTVVTPQ